MHKSHQDSKVLSCVFMPDLCVEMDPHNHKWSCQELENELA